MGKTNFIPTGSIYKSTQDLSNLFVTHTISLYESGLSSP